MTICLGYFILGALVALGGCSIAGLLGMLHDWEILAAAVEGPGEGDDVRRQEAR